MLEIFCSGTPYEIGFKHGSTAKEHVVGSIKFYTDYFSETCRLGWDAAEKAARGFLPFLEEHVPYYVEEMKGIADGAGVSFDAVLTLNARSEIAMGMMDDGCTSLSWKTNDFAIGAQNWDWEDAQKARLVLMHIKPEKTGVLHRPNVSVIAEAGMLCKSGLNSYGVAVLVNAIKAKGVKFNALPFHIGMRVGLDSQTRLKSITRLRTLTIGTSGHIMIADRTGATSLEFSHLDVQQLEMVDGKISHTNHFLVKHDPRVVDAFIFPDSFSRETRITELLCKGQERISGGVAPIRCVELMLEDEQGFPTAINRKSSKIRRSETLYSFVADLEAKTARLRLGRPTEPEGEWILTPSLL